MHADEITAAFNADTAFNADALGEALAAPTYPDNAVMFFDGAVARTEGLPVDATLANLLTTYEHAPAASRNPLRVTKPALHAMFHRTASISEIEPRTYQHFANNPASIANWLPPLVRAHAAHGAARSNPSALQIPRTQIMRLDESLAQFTRVQYHETNDISKQTFNAYLEDTLDLPDDAFIKTGTFSGKFQFANCHCTEPDEMGEYFQVITNHAQVIGAGESIDIAVRDYIVDHDEDRPTIYGGMPLRCEYRLFVDFGAIDDAACAHWAAEESAPMTDTAMRHAFGLTNVDGAPLPAPRVLGVTHYWHPRVMRAHFGRIANDAMYAQFAASNTNAEQMRDADAYASFESRLREDFDAYVDTVVAAVDELLPHMQAAGFRGAWSIDVMCNTAESGEIEYYLIDMALACESALIDELYTVEEMRFADLDEIVAVTSGEIMAYPQAPDFVPGTYTDGHGVQHSLHAGRANDALRAGVARGIVATDGSAAPRISHVDTRRDMPPVPAQRALAYDNDQASIDDAASHEKE